MIPTLNAILSTPGDYDGINYPDFATYLGAMACAARNSFSHMTNRQLFLGTLIDDAVTSAMLRFFPNEFRRSNNNDPNQCDIVHISGGNDYPISFKHSSRSNGIGRTDLWFCLRWGTNALPTGYQADCDILVFLSTQVPITHLDEPDLEAGFYFSSQTAINQQITQRGFLTNNRTISGFSFLHLRDEFRNPTNQYVLGPHPQLNSATSRLDYGLTL